MEKKNLNSIAKLFTKYLLTTTKNDMKSSTNRMPYRHKHTLFMSILNYKPNGSTQLQPTLIIVDKTTVEICIQKNL